MSRYPLDDEAGLGDDQVPVGGDRSALHALPAIFCAWLIAAAAFLLLAGCGGRAPATQVEAERVQQVAEADAGLVAAKSALGASMTPQAADILDGAAAWARATAGEVKIPASSWTPERIVAAPADYRRAGEAAERKANGTQVWFWLKVVGGAVGTVLLPLIATVLGKELPIAGPIIARWIGFAWEMGASKATKQEDEARTILASHTSQVLELAMAALPPSEVQRLSRGLPPEVVDAAQRIGIALPSARTLADVPAPSPSPAGPPG
jgi:hypothetical protein